MGKKILIVDDEPHIRDMVQFALEKAGMGVLEATHGEEALDVIKKALPDLIVLDINMPEMDGLELCKTLRKTSDIPILFLSSRDEEVDKIIGLEIGGDDYVTKPFSPRELVARINVILKRTQQSKTDKISHTKTHGHVSIDEESYCSYWQGSNVPLTATEFMLLKALLGRPQKVFSRDNLIKAAHGFQIMVSDRTIDSHIKRIRGKYAKVGGQNIIETVHGIGYKLGSCQ